MRNRIQLLDGFVMGNEEIIGTDDMWYHRDLVGHLLPLAVEGD